MEYNGKNMVNTRWRGSVLVLLCLFGGISCYRVTAPSNVTLFVDTFSVGYQIPPNVNMDQAIIEFVHLESDTMITGLMLARLQDHPNGSIIVECGTIDQPGNYAIRLKEKSDGAPLAETNLMVTFPIASMVLPTLHRTLANDVLFHFTIRNVECLSKHRTRKFWLDLVHYPQNDTRRDDESGPPIVARSIARRNLTDLSNIHDKVYTFLCQLFDLAGSYKVILKSNFNTESVLTSSNTMFTMWSNKYSLQIDQESIFVDDEDCNRFITVFYQQPRCVGDSDKIRLYQQVKTAESSQASPITELYITEQRPFPGSASVEFSCSYFDESTFGYCFKYFSVAANNQLKEQDKICVPTLDLEDVVIDGSWGSWTEWLDCNVRCGSGHMRRFRTCDNPEPQNGGRFCEGDSSQDQPCAVPCSGMTTPSLVKPYTPDPSCPCGCALSEDAGKFAPSLSCKGSTVWLISVQKGHIIKLTFDVFSLDPNNHQSWIKVRDGDSQMSDLVVNNYGDQRATPVYSSQNYMWIEYMAAYDTGSGQVEGFVASYLAVVDNGTLVTGYKDTKSQMLWEISVTVVGITLLIIIIIASIAYICHIQIQKKRKKAKQQQASQSLLRNGEVANSPSHSGQSIQGSNNVSFSDPLSSPNKSPTKRDYIIAKGVSPTSPISNPTDVEIGFKSNLKSKRPKQASDGPYTVDSAQTRHSSHNSVHSSLHSPYKGASHNSDYTHDPSLFRVSPTLEDDRQSRRPPHKGEPPHHKARTPTSPNRHQSSPTRKVHSPVKEDNRNTSFKTAIHRGQPGGPPLAGEEDLSPMSPVTPTGGYYVPHSGTANPNKILPLPQSRNKNREDIPMEQYGKTPHPDSQQMETQLHSPARRRQLSPGKRPPTEGRDSLNGKYKDNSQTSPHIQQLPTPDRQNGNYIQQPTSNTKPVLQPLPLRNVQRPDGQSPENRPGDLKYNSSSTINTPSSSHTLSPILRNTKLFPDAGSKTPSELEVAIDGDFEYDDYVPNLPGSYFNMDPHAYTLTWSQQPRYPGQKPAPPPVNSRGGSRDKLDNDVSHC